MTMGIVSLNVGKPVTVDYQGKDLSTGIYKQPVEGPLFLSSLNFEGMVRPISSITAAWIRRCARTPSSIILIGNTPWANRWRMLPLAKT